MVDRARSPGRGIKKINIKKDKEVMRDADDF
ncbi:hypothetical protein ES705_32764 [subsurface metagenome]